MLIDVIMPQLGESVSEGTITKWLVREGDIVKKDQPLLEIATDKADSELPAPVGGRVAKLLAKEGDVVAVKTLVCQIEEGVAAPAESPPKASSAGSVPHAPATAQAGDGGRGGAALASPAVRK